MSGVRCPLSGVRPKFQKFSFRRILPCPSPHGILSVCPPPPPLRYCMSVPPSNDYFVRQGAYIHNLVCVSVFPWVKYLTHFHGTWSWLSVCSLLFTLLEEILRGKKTKIARRLIFGMQLNFNLSRRNIREKIGILLRSLSKSQF